MQLVNNSKSLFQMKVACREQVKLMVGITGPSGAGKTLSALHLAYGITKDWSKIALADTENRSAQYYAGERTGPWNHIDFPSTTPRGYHPDNWIALLDMVEQQRHIDVLIFDSISHEWEGVGGCLDLNTKMGGRFQDWAKVTPLHSRFVDRMRESRLHVIATMRSKQDYVIEQNDKGKAAPRKVGLRSVQREGTDYEFGIILDIDMAHFATASKDRTGLFSERGPFQVTADTGSELLAWSRDGEEKVYEGTASQKRELKGLLVGLGVPEDRMAQFHMQLIGIKMEYLREKAEELILADALEG